MIEVPEGCRLIVLDLDGTLAVLPIDWHGLKAALAQMYPDVSFARLTAGLRAVEERHGAAGRRACFEVIRRFERDSLPGMTPVREVVDLVAACRHSTQLAICSNNLHETIEDVLRELGLRDAFGILVGRDDVAECKPAPEGLLGILDELHLPAASALFIGNHSSDAEAGRRAGIRTVLVEAIEPGRD